MTREETTQVLAILKAAYPASYSGLTKREALGVVSVWSTQLADVPVDIVMIAVNKLIATSKFPPTICEVKEKLSAIYWEAYSQIRTAKMIGGEGSAEWIGKMERLMHETSRYQSSHSIEPSLAQLKGSTAIMLGIEGGDADG